MLGMLGGPALLTCGFLRDSFSLTSCLPQVWYYIIPLISPLCLPFTKATIILNYTHLCYYLIYRPPVKI